MSLLGKNKETAGGRSSVWACLLFEAVRIVASNVFCEDGGKSQERGQHVVDV